MIDEYKKNNKKLQVGFADRQYKVIKIIRATEGQSIDFLWILSIIIIDNFIIIF